MKQLAATALGIALFTAPAFADGHATGDADSGEKLFNKCKACHMIEDEEGNTILKGGRTGPNLYGIYQRVAGSADYKYGKSLVEAGEAGLEWNEEEFVKYLADPKKYLATYNDDKRAKSKMSFKLKKADDAADVWAYLVSVGPEVKADSDS
ncbi:c-type cytochrome [Sulfitobacter sp. HNIBRBA2951]|uniref:c-type cytochrome n=1 Tax=Sulfitobacter aquimarinus TaxID=3158557 RepID=UPI0032E05728